MSEAKGNRLVIFLSSGGFAAAWQATSLAVSAQAMGTQVWMVLGFAALEAFLNDNFGAAGEDEAEFVKRQLATGAATPLVMLQSLQSLGGKVVACDSTFHMVTDDTKKAAQLDEVLGLPSIWSHARGAQVVSF
jgi:peroxiredoxin family protein